MKLTSRWPNDRSARIRRAACQSLMQRKAKTTDERLPPILRRLELFVKDDDIYVRKCLRPIRRRLSRLHLPANFHALAQTTGTLD
jgi:3-methyladenine DNA glycosylase AlkD